MHRGTEQYTCAVQNRSTTMTMNVDIGRKGILIGLLDWLYDEFGDDLPAVVRMPVHLALAIANKANPEQKAKLKHATKADIEDAILHSSLAAEYAAKGMLKAQAIDDAVRHLHRAFVEGVDSLHAEHALLDEKVTGAKGSRVSAGSPSLGFLAPLRPTIGVMGRRRLA